MKKRLPVLLALLVAILSAFTGCPNASLPNSGSPSSGNTDPSDAGNGPWARVPLAANGNSDYLGAATDRSGNVYAIGILTGTGNFDLGDGVVAQGAKDNQYAFLVKYDGRGKSLWSANLGAAEGSSWFAAVSLDSMGNIYAVGHISGNASIDLGNSVTVKGSSTGRNCVIVKYSSEGKALWARTAQSGSVDSTYSGVTVDDNGAIYAVGYLKGTAPLDLGNGITVSGSSQDATMVMVKYTAEGTVLWARTATTAPGYSVLNSVAASPLGGIIAAGVFSGAGSLDVGNGVILTGASAVAHGLVVQYDREGNASWARTEATGTGSSNFASVAVDGTGQVYCAGYLTGISGYDFGNSATAQGTISGSTAVVVSYTPTGSPNWARTVQGPIDSFFLSVAADTGGGIVVAGYVSGHGTWSIGNGPGFFTSSSGSSALLVKYDADGGGEWVRSPLVNSGGSLFNGVACARSGAIHAVGSVSGSAGYDFGAGLKIQGVYSLSNALALRYAPGSGTIAQKAPETPRDVLTTLYQAMHGESWTKSDNWGSDRPLSEWYGVVLEGDEVVELNLGSNNLSGYISAELAKLKKLRKLDLSGNQLAETIPPELGSCASLQDLDVSDNLLKGTLPPELAGIPALSSGNFRCKGNRFTGTLPRVFLQLDSWPKLYGSGNVLPQQPNFYGFKYPTETSTDFSLDGTWVKLRSATKGSGGIDIVLLGDGFIDQDMSSGKTYETLLQKAMDYFFSIEPVASYRDYFNVYLVRAVSRNRSAPPYFMANKTAFSLKAPDNWSFATFNLQAVKNYLAKLPIAAINNASVLIIPNYESEIYGFRASTMSYYGQPYRCLSVSRVPVDSEFEGLIHHELDGHGFGLLTDEYVENGGTITDEAAEKIAKIQRQCSGWMNVDLTNDLAAIKWKAFLGESRYAGVIGAFEGAALYELGVWRPEEASCMDTLYSYFNGPSREAIVRRIMDNSGGTFSWTDFLAQDANWASPPGQLQGKGIRKSGSAKSLQDLTAPPQVFLPGEHD